MQKNNLYALYPPCSITASRGNDGSGLHSGENKDLQSQKVSDDIYGIDNMYEVVKCSEMERKVADFYRAPGIKIINYITYIFYRAPGGYFLYNFFRGLVKKLRKL